MSEVTDKNTSKQSNEFKWTNEMVEDLLKCIGQYKANMEYKGKDFNSDKPRQYETVRNFMVKMNQESYSKFFGPADADEDDIKNLKKKGKLKTKKLD